MLVPKIVKLLDFGESGFHVPPSKTSIPQNDHELRVLWPTPISSSWICDTNGSAVSGEVLLGLEAANRFALFGRGGG